MPVEPPPSPWALPDVTNLDGNDELVAVGADLEPGTLLAAYRSGLFPMPLPEEASQFVDRGLPLGWWSPDPRGILPLDGLHVSRSLQRSLRTFEVKVDTQFDAVIRACADPERPHGWITPEFISAYKRMHDYGWAHSIEIWNVETGELAGGLYGLAIGGLFAAESKFHWETDASKAAVAGLVQLLKERNYALLDVQWRTDHLATLGVIDIARAEYLERLKSALEVGGEPLGPLEKPRRFQALTH